MAAVIVMIVGVGTAMGCRSRRDDDAHPPPPVPLPSLLEIRYLAGSERFRDASLLTVEVDDGVRHRTVSGAELGRTSANTFDSPKYEIATSGQLSLRAVLRSPGGDTLADVSWSVPLEPDYQVSVMFLVRPPLDRPQPPGFGVAGERAVPLRGPTSVRGDSLFVAWGVNWISKPVVY